MTFYCGKIKTSFVFEKLRPKNVRNDFYLCRCRRIKTQPSKLIMYICFGVVFLEKYVEHLFM